MDCCLVTGYTAHRIQLWKEYLHQARAWFTFGIAISSADLRRC